MLSYLGQGELSFPEFPSCTSLVRESFCVQVDVKQQVVIYLLTPFIGLRWGRGLQLVSRPLHPPSASLLLLSQARMYIYAVMKGPGFYKTPTPSTSKARVLVFPCGLYLMLGNRLVLDYLHFTCKPNSSQTKKKIPKLHPSPYILSHYIEKKKPNRIGQIRC